MASSRAFAAALAVVTSILAGCGGSDGELRSDVATLGSGAQDDRVRLPQQKGGSRCKPGEYALRLENGRSARLRITPGESKRPRGLILAFHGAGGSPRDGLYVFREAWDEPGLVLLAPGALGSTWSAIHGEDRDLETVNQALAETWRRCRIDRRRVAVGGFSDGATHALSIGLQNGGIFRSVMALSPGGLLAVAHRGKPRVFISHGTGDDVLPYSRSRKSIVPGLRGSGYSVTFRSFVGGHEVPTSISRAAVRWYLHR
ncbi:serine esterase [soil metagenome]